MSSTSRSGHFSYTSKSYWVLGILSALEILLLFFLWFDPTQIRLWLAIAGLLFVSFNFSSVTVGIDREVIVFVWGIGLIQRVFYVSDITGLAMKRNNTIWALYTGASPQALAVTDRSGRRATIGIGDTRKMLEFLKSHARGE